MTSAVKQVIVVRKDLNMRKGKIAAQVAHASMKVILDRMEWGELEGHEGDLDGETASVGSVVVIDSSALSLWLAGSFTKICISVDSEAELLEVFSKAQAAGILCSLIQDSGKTEFNGVPTYTCAAIGPAYSEEINPITGHLPLL